MSAVPPNFTASVLQSNLAQRQVSIVRDAERNQRASADTLHARTVDQADSTVEITSESSDIYADAEGAGSQGRAFSSPDEPVETPVVEDDGEGQHIDLSA